MKTLYTFNQLEKLKLPHGFTTKNGGVSTGKYSSFNFTTSTGDKKENVYENFRVLAKTLGSDVDSLVAADQTHTTNVLKVDTHHKGMGITKPRDFKDIDGLITNEKNLALVTYHADCVPLYFYDRKQEAIGLAHAGWRGVVHGMAEKMIVSMKDAYGSHPEDLICCIGPSIKACCFQVEEDVIDIFRKEQGNVDEFIKKDCEDGKYLVDLQSFIYKSFVKNGVKADNIEEATDCTKCLSDTYFSHRKVGRERGSMVGVLMMKDLRQ